MRTNICFIDCRLLLSSPVARCARHKGFALAPVSPRLALPFNQVPRRTATKQGSEYDTIGHGTPNWHSHRRRRRSRPEFRHQRSGLPRHGKPLRSRRHPPRLGRPHAPESRRSGQPRSTTSCRSTAPTPAPSTATGGTMLHSSRTNPSKMKALPPFLSPDSFPAAEWHAGISARTC